MIEKLNLLSLEDKLFMINNPNSFSLPSRVIINYNTRQWMEDINNGLSTKVIEYEKEKCAEINEIITQVPTLIDDPDTVDMFSKLFRKIWIMPCESKQDICNIIALFNVYHEKFTKAKLSIAVDKYDKYIKKIIKAFLKILKFKLTAHEIANQSNSDIACGDELLNKYCNSEFKCLVDDFLNSTDLNHLVIVLYMIYAYLDLDVVGMGAPTFKPIVRDLHGYGIDEITASLISVDNGDVNAMEMIDNVDVMDTTKFTSFILKSCKRAIEENYRKNKVSDKGVHDELVIGDPVFLNSGITVNNLLVEIAKLNEDSIRNYIGGDKIISYNISEREIGYLKVREELPICKLLDKKGNFYTLTNYDNKSYLLFNVYNSDKLFGLSFPADYAGERKLISIEIPNNLDYKLEI